MEAIKPEILEDTMGKTEDEKKKVENLIRELFPYIVITTQIAKGKIKSIKFAGEIIFKEKANG